MASAPLIEVSELAAEKLGEIMSEQGDDGSLLRMMVVPGQNGGFQYMLGMEKEAKENDFVIETTTIQVLVDPESAPLVEGAQIDYVEDLMRSGFVISNPNFAAAGGGGGCGSGGCGCGAGGGGCGGGGEASGGDGEASGGGGCACGGH